MDESKLIEELKENCESNREKLAELLKTYELAVLGYDIQEQRIKDVYNRVLVEHEFFASRDFDRCNVKPGDRITDEEYAFLMSDEDFKVYNEELGTSYLCKEGITDEKGYYLTNWLEIKTDAMCELVDFIIDCLVPTTMRDIFSRNRRNVIVCDKLINSLKSSFKAA